MKVGTALCIALLVTLPGLLPAQSGVRPNPDALGIYHVGDGVTPPKLIYSEAAEFPDSFRKKKMTGHCVVSLLVDTDGRPQNVSVYRSAAEDLKPKLKPTGLLLDQNAIKAVQTYRFEPATFEGRAVPVPIHVDVSFQIY